jgi:2-polyprenyl-6-methoxyphenol hydroxylase-like FAD-dependent oxidoreductase
MARMGRPFDVCIRGAGIVGRALALQLAAKRLRVALVDPQAGDPASGHSDVRAYALNAASRDFLEALRCWPDAQHATPVLSMQVFGDQGGALRFDAADQGAAALNWMVDVPALEALLVQALRFQSLVTVMHEPCAAPLTVICEGKTSSTRAQLGADFVVQAYPQHALAARVACSFPHQQIARQWFFDHQGQGEILAMLPLDGEQGSACALVWSLSPERAQAMQAAPAEAFCQELAALSGDTLGALMLISARSVWPLQSARAQQWCGSNAQGAWVLAGDAAHAVHPLAGQGLNLGLGDALALAKVLDARPYWRGVGDMRLLRTYQRERITELALVGGVGDAMQQIFYQQSPLLASARNWGMSAFSRSGPVKQWVARRAMGLPASSIK